jgi:hypothetical protein
MSGASGLLSIVKTASAVLLLLAALFNAHADASDTAHIDAPLWPLLLGQPLQTIVVDLQILGDAPSNIDRGGLEHKYAAYLRQALQAEPHIRVATYTDALFDRTAGSHGATVVVHYKVTLKNWPGGHQSAVLLGAVESDIEHLWRRIPKNAVYSPTELFQSALDADGTSRTITEIVTSHMDRFVVLPVKRAFSQ